MEGVQRFLYGGVNKVRTAVSMTGPVRSIEDAVIQKPVARSGSLVAAIAGIYTGDEEALYELEVVDAVADTPIVTAPIFIGVGNGAMEDIVAGALTPRTVEATLADLGQILKAASTDLQGVTLMMKTPGADGNDFWLEVDRSGLDYTLQPYSLIEDLKQGTAAAPGPQYDWQTVTASFDGIVPPGAKRIVFGEDRRNVYVQYKQVEEGKVVYHFEPEIQQDVPAKTQVWFVGGTYTVTLYEDVAGVPTLRETYAGITTLYDLLNAIRSTSAYLLVQGAVANDRTSGGQALLELTLNTDAQIVQNSGEGSDYAKGFVDVDISANSPTELIEATCIASNPTEASGAGLGYELWELRGSVTGLLNPSLKTGDLYSNAYFAARIPQRLPPGYVNLPRGSFTVKEINYNTSDRVLDEETGEYSPLLPPICVDSRTLGINAQDCVITLNYKKRPAENNCSCSEDRGIALSPFCLGVVTDPEGGSNMPYKPETITRLEALYDWFADTVRLNSSYFSGSSGVYVGSTLARQDPFISQPGPHSVQRDPTLLPESVIGANTAYVSMFELIKQFELTLADVDKLSAGALKVAAEAAWDAAVEEFQDDVNKNLSGTVLGDDEVVEASEALAAGDAVGVYYDGPDLKVRKATIADHRYGFVDAAVISGANATVKYTGINGNVVSTEEMNEGAPILAMPFWRYYPSVANPGQWVLNKGGMEVAPVDIVAYGSLKYLSTTSGQVDNATVANAALNPIGMALLPDRYKSRLQHVLISGGISPLGKGDADTGGGDGCWRDNGDQYFWEVLVGEQKYAPAFTGEPYYSSLKYPGGVVVNGTMTPSEGYYSTREFGFILDIPCKDELVVGDQVVLVIGNAGVEPTYVKGDKLYLGLVAAAPIDFFGGNDGDNVQTWHVQDSVDGARPPYLLDTDAPADYVDGGLSFLITQGPIPYAKGDLYRFSIEGGNFRWRKTVTGGAPGAWSAPADITLAPFVLDEGLSLQWRLGASPAIFDGDQYAFLALQPYALSNLIRPDFDRWEWDADPAELEIDLGAASDIEAVALAFHTITPGATVEVEGGIAAGVYTWSELVVWRKDVMATLLAAPQTARYLRVTITGSEAGGIGWLYAGEAVRMTYSAQVQLQREYKVKRSDGVNPNSLYQGTGLAGTITFPEGHVKEADYDKLTSMLDWLKSHDDEALVFYPQESRADEIILATVESDEIVFADVFQFQPGVAYERRISCTIPLRGVAFK